MRRLRPGALQASDEFSHAIRVMTSFQITQCPPVFAPVWSSSQTRHFRCSDRDRPHANPRYIMTQGGCQEHPSCFVRAKVMGNASSIVLKFISITSWSEPKGSRPSASHRMFRLLTCVFWGFPVTCLPTIYIRMFEFEGEGKTGGRGFEEQTLEGEWNVKQ